MPLTKDEWKKINKSMELMHTAVWEGKKRCVYIDQIKALLVDYVQEDCKHQWTTIGHIRMCCHCGAVSAIPDKENPE